MKNVTINGKAVYVYSHLAGSWGSGESPHRAWPEVLRSQPTHRASLMGPLHHGPMEASRTILQHFRCHNYHRDLFRVEKKTKKHKSHPVSWRKATIIATALVLGSGSSKEPPLCCPR